MKSIGKIFLFIFILAVLIFGYILISKKGTSAPASAGTLSSTTGAANIAGNGTSAAQSQLGREFLTTLLNLKTITLDDSIFTAPAFTSLQDFTAPVATTDIEGRQNPFAPLGLDAAAAGSQGTDNSLVPTTPLASANSPDATGAGASLTVSTLPAGPVTRTTATLNGSLSGAPTGTRYFEWGKTSALGTKTAETAGAGDTWLKKITGLTPGATYSFRAVANIGTQTIYGPIITLTTQP